MWKEVKVEGEAWDFTKEATVEGVYVNKDTEVGPNKSNMYHLEQGDGSIVKVWGSTVLDNKFAELEKESVFGQTKVKITFLGMEKGKRGEYKNWKLEVWDKDTKVVHDDDIPVINTDDIPF